MNRTQRIAIWLATLVITLALWKVFGQGFGNFRSDQPYLARNYTSAVSNSADALPVGIGYWWNASDLSSSPVNNWTDRVAGVVMTNSGSTTPTWTTNGVQFTRSSSQFLRTTSPITLYSTNAFLLVVTRTGDVGDQWIIGHDSLSQTWIRWNSAMNWTTENEFGFAASPLNAVQDFIFRGMNIGMGSQDQGYTNGILAFTSSSALMNTISFGYFGTYVDKNNYGDFLLKELIVWTNGRWASATAVSNVHWYATNIWKHSP